MPKTRIKPKPDLREVVLNEFNHRCSICGADRPQLHHIDENPANNDPANLLPLCPNHHLTDQHDPTRRIDPMLLSLFRQYKDPQILSSRFGPIFKRLKPLLGPYEEYTFEDLAETAVDLALFIKRFEMGEYYYDCLSRLLSWATPKEFIRANAFGSNETFRRLYIERLERNIQSAIAYLIEQLRYQNWPEYKA